MKNHQFSKKRLEGKRTIFFQIGMIIALSIVLIAFEWKSEMKKPVIIDSGYGHHDDVELPDITKQPEKKKEIPSKPEPQISKLEVTDDKTEVEDFDFTVEAKADDAVPQDIPPEIPDEPNVGGDVFVPFPQEQAEFPGGYVALMKYLANNLEYTRQAREMGINGKVLVYFEVGTDGSLSKIEILRGLGYGLDEEVIRVLKASPKWIPGKQGGRAVKSPFRLPVNFKLAD